MREILFSAIFIATSLVLQIFFLRFCQDNFGLKKIDPRFQRMVNLIYVNLGIYVMLICILIVQFIKK